MSADLRIRYGENALTALGTTVDRRDAAWGTLGSSCCRLRGDEAPGDPPMLLLPASAVTALVEEPRAAGISPGGGVTDVFMQITGLRQACVGREAVRLGRASRRTDRRMRGTTRGNVAEAQTALRRLMLGRLSMAITEAHEKPRFGATTFV